MALLWIGPGGQRAAAMYSLIITGSKTASPWLLQLLERRPRKLAAVALANKMARTVWAMMTSGQTWRMPKASSAA